MTQPSTETALKVEDLRKLYGDLVAVDGVSFTARRGEIYGLLGPNGAGKSTTIGCASGLHRPSEGQVHILGHDVVLSPAEAKARLGVVPQELAFYPELSARRNLEFWGSLYGLSGTRLRARVDSVLDRIGLTHRADERVDGFSGGMKRRLNFGCGVVHQPEVLLLDEPTVGVDPQSRERLLDMVREQAADGTCVLYTTHHMEEAETLCDRLGVIDHGKIVVEGTLDDLRRSVGGRELLRLGGRFDPERVRRLVLDPARWPARDTEIVDLADHHLVLSTPEASERLPRIFDALTGDGAKVHETHLTRPSLESLFIQLTGDALRE